MDLEYHSNLRSDIVPLVPKVRRVLDIGGGTGVTARHLKAIGRAEEVGVIDAVADAARDELDFAFSGNLDEHGAVEAFLAEEGPFGAILLLDVLEHLVDPWALVDLVSRHLEPGGVLVASIPNIRHFSVSAGLLFGNHWTYTDAGLLDRTHLRFFVRDTAIALLDRPGLAVTQVVPSPIGGRKKRLANALTLGLLRSFLTLQYFVVARRNG